MSFEVIFVLGKLLSGPLLVVFDDFFEVVHLLAVRQGSIL